MVVSCDGLWQADAVADGRLSAKEPSFERHLRVCAECRARLASNEKVRALVHDLAAETQPPDFFQAITTGGGLASFRS